MNTPALGQGPAADKFSEGMRKLRTAALLQIIAWILVVAGLAVGYGAIFAVLGMPLSNPPEHGTPSDIAGSLGVAVGALVGVAVAVLAGVVLVLVATYGYLLPASSSFAEFDRERYGTVSTLLKVGYLGGLLTLIVGIVVIVAGAAAQLLGFVLVGLIVAIIGLILFIVGYIGLIILMFKLRKDTGEDTFLVAGVLFIIGIFVSLLAIVAWILVYVAAKPGSRPVRGPTYSGPDVLPPPPPA